MSIDQKIPYVMGISAGIGSSIAEAEEALFKAKQRKKKRGIDPFSVKDNPPYYIDVYEGNKKPDKFKIDARIKDYLKVFEFLIDNKSRYASKLEKLVKIDLGTTALTPLGYKIEEYKRENGFREKRKQKSRERHFILLDMNDTHYWNEKGASYKSVTNRINATGKSLVDGCRTRKNGRMDFVAQRFPLVNRKHGDAGDEFIIDLYCPKKYLVGITKRLIEAEYKAQKEVMY